MKRFWTDVAVVAEGDGWAIMLDGKPIRTPARAPLLVPTATLAGAIAGEWDQVSDRVDPRAMPLTGLANAAIDRVASDPAAFAEGLARYGEGELACYRADSPRELVEWQAREWDPLLGWARRRFDIDFVTTCGIVHVDQPPATLQRLRHELAMLDPFRLAGLSPLVSLGGSLVAGLAVMEGSLDGEAAWAAVSVDEQWQSSQWGADSEAEERLAERKAAFLDAEAFCRLLDQP